MYGGNIFIWLPLKSEVLNQKYHPVENSDMCIVNFQWTVIRIYLHVMHWSDML